MGWFLKSLCLLFTLFAMNAYSLEDSPYYSDEAINDEVMCVGDLTQRCINVLCLTSESRDCQEDCENMAIKKCQAI